VRRTTLALASAAGLGLAAQLLFYGHLLGVNAPIAAALFLALAWRLREHSIDPRDAWIPASAFVFAALLAVRTEAAVVVFDALAGVGLCLATAAALGAPIMRMPFAALVRRTLATGIASASGAWQLTRLARSEPQHLGRLDRLTPYAAGLGLSLPLLAVFAILFSSADEVFGHAMREAFGPDTLRELPGRVVLAVVVAWIAAGALTLLWRVAPPAPDLPRPLRRETATVLLIAVDVLFALFVAIQITYLFGGTDTVRAAGITYSAYARRGFFELVAAAIIVAVLLFGADLLVERGRRIHLGPAVVLVALTGVILVSALYRLDLYQRAFAWSELRFHAIAAIAFLALALVVLAWALLAGRMAYAVQPIALAAVLVAVGVNLIAPSAFVARANVSRVLDPSSLPDDAERTLDVLYLYRLGDAAVPVLIEAAPSLPERERSCLDALLRWQLSWRHDLGSAVDWRSWSYDRARAADAWRSFAAAIPVSGRDDHLADARRSRQLGSALEGCGRDPR
jgi:hypothetical protein